ncbi:Vacuolar fusion protein Mon1 [Trinorchestia longiramus]|nr:Vacuolar fusion protein Mon1 [Trinorchestia longiramus]
MNVSDLEVEPTKDGTFSSKENYLQPKSSSKSYLTEQKSKITETNENLLKDASADSAKFESLQDVTQNEQLLNSLEWLGKRKHVFILSESGKPVYSRYGAEDRLVTLFGLLQALVSIVSDNGDVLHSVQAGSHKFVFLVRSPLILAAVVDTDASTTQLLLQLVYVNSVVESVSTRAALQRHYSKRRNCDLRDLLGGTDRLITSLLHLQDTEPGLLLGAHHSLPLPHSIRSEITQALVQACSKIKNLVFGVVLTGLQVVSVVRLKSVVLHPADLHILCNLVQASDSLRASENWMPICLPQFDPDGYLYGHVSYLSEGCDACLLLLTVDKEHFFTLSQAKQKITEKLRRQHILEKMVYRGGEGGGYTAAAVGCAELRHFLYKNKALAQYTAPVYSPPYQTEETMVVPVSIYERLQQRLQCQERPLKMIYTAADDHATIAWETHEFELYAILEPLTTKQSAIDIVNKILKYVSQEEQRLFMLYPATF